MKKIILTLIASLLIGLSVKFYLESQKNNLPRFSSIIYSDLESAKEKKFFPEQINSLSAIKIAVHSKNKALKDTLKKNIYLPLQTTEAGKYSLQIDAIENLDPITEAQMILQFNLFENESRNKVWESSRLYSFKPEDLKDLDLNSKNDKKKPD